MATMTRHSPVQRGSVTLDIDVPAQILAAKQFAPIRALRAAFVAAQRDVDAAYDAWDEAKEAKGIREAAIVRAVRENTTPPAEMSETEAQARIKVATEGIVSALHAAKRAVDAYEAALVANRPALRDALAPSLRAIHEAYTEAKRIADGKEAERSMFLRAYNTLDNAVALADDLAAGERTYRHRRALGGARSKVEDPIAAALEGVDYLESEDYLTARRGQAHYEAVNEARTELQTIRNGDVRFLTYADRARAEASVIERLRNLGIRS